MPETRLHEAWAMTTTGSSASDSTAILARGLRKTYKDTVAVDHVDLEVRTGEVFAFLGPNGAGKTTTTEMLEGYRTPDAGELRVLGEIPEQADLAWRSRIGIVLQQTRDLATLGVGEALKHFARYFPNPRDPQDVIDAVGLAEKRRAKIGTLSGGQRRRLDVALGIIGRPELLFLDEPTTGFDPEARREFWALIHQLRDEGTTILLTTHYLDEAEQLADRVGVIVRGRLIDVDTPQRLGGRHLAQSSVSWVDRNGPHRVMQADPQAVVNQLATSPELEVRDLTVTKPSLEDIYLQMIGENR
jgi:ABC-2 type transport system ATP-binding protein